jgi:hypothetical protein
VLQLARAFFNALTVDQNKLRACSSKIMHALGTVSNPRSISLPTKNPKKDSTLKLGKIEEEQGWHHAEL